MAWRSLVASSKFIHMHATSSSSPDFVTLELHPLGRHVPVPRGSALQDVLFAHGVEFPCGGRGRCKGCRVRILDGELPITPEDQERLEARELAAGWRLACRAHADRDLRIELAQWEATILADDSRFAFVPGEGFGVAVDLGTTTVVAQLLDRRTAQVLSVRMGLNVQAWHGADIMSRIEYAVGGGQATLTSQIRKQIDKMIASLLAESGVAPAEVREVVMVGNTVMHHLFCGVDVQPLAQHPFEPAGDGLIAFEANALEWASIPKARVHFLPCLGGFVGSDILAGLLATRLPDSEDLGALIDLGTNGEIVVGNRRRMLCASTAAGPAFEGARIAAGMRAATGAISAVSLEDGAVHCRVIGNVAPRGLCGSGLVDAVACGLDLGHIGPTGRFQVAGNLPLAGQVALTQADVRELQLAKGAIAAGIRLLAGQLGAGLEDIRSVHLAGAFGNYISLPSARRIGLLPFPLERVVPAGNTALLGAKLALFGLPGDSLEFGDLRERISHVVLNDDPQFQDTYVDDMLFPELTPS